jgi:divalent metal cation (Fe/Co/Zn/Cd) transporter
VRLVRVSAAGTVTRVGNRPNAVLLLARPFAAGHGLNSWARLRSRSVNDTAAMARQPVLHQALRLEYLTVGWNIAEGLIAVAAGRAAGSVALVGFGLDSFVETGSGGILIWRLLSERRMSDRASIERLDRKAHKLVGVSLFLLALYVLGDATWTLLTGARPRTTAVGLVVTSVSLLVMLWLARAKRRAAGLLASRALKPTRSKRPRAGGCR